MDKYRISRASTILFMFARPPSAQRRPGSPCLDRRQAAISARHRPEYRFMFDSGLRISTSCVPRVALKMLTRRRKDD